METDNSGCTPGEGKIGSLNPVCPNRLYDLQIFRFNGHTESFLAAKRPQSDSDHSFPCSDKAKNEWRYTSVPPFMRRTATA